MSKYHHKQSDTSFINYIQRGLLLGAAFVVRIISIQAQGLWRDEVDQWRFALEPWPVLWQHFTQIGWNGPLFSPMLRGWLRLTGDSVFAMRYLSLLFGILSIALLYTLGKHLLDEKVAVLSAALMTFSPYMIWYAQEIKMYTWFVLLVLLALYALCRAGRDHHWRWWLLLSSTCLLLFYSHILGPLLVPILGVWAGYVFRDKPKIWLGLLIGGLSLALLSLPLLLWQVPLALQARETGFPHYTLGQMIGTLLNGWCAGLYQADLLHENLALYSLSAFVILGLAGCVELFIRQRGSLFILIGIWLSLPLGILWAISLNSPLFTDRYLIWCAPAFYLLVSAGIVGLSRLDKWLKPLLLAGLLTFNTLSLYAQTQHAIKPEFPQAVAHLRQHHTPDALLLFQIPHNHHVVAYYDADLLTAWAAAPFTNWRLADGSYQVGADYVNEQMPTRIGAHRDIWLVYSEAAMWDERDLVRAWFETHAKLVDMQSYWGVTLYHYELGL